ncbi:MAG: IMP dehydrogenase [Rickettsiaceae bacterium H1]|nr:IMP dehydrogenase [Rickettsiaceae bacterium H1]
MEKIIKEGYTFDDLLLIPAKSSVLPHEVQTETFLTKRIKLSVPLISAAMDTVTESKLAIAIAQQGGIGTIHKNLSIQEQAQEVRKVKKHESWIVTNPITIDPDAPLYEVVKLQRKHGYSGIPVIEKITNKLVGILTDRDLRFIKDHDQPVRNLMTTKLVTVKSGIEKKEALKLLHDYRIERLLVADDNGQCIGLITVKDILKFDQNPNACKDDKSRLRVSAAISTGKNAIKRAEALIGSEVDAIIVDTAHGHSQQVINTIKEIKNLYPEVQLIGGNIATADAAEELINAGVDAVKVGIGPGSICTTRVIAGVGVPQITAIMNVNTVCKKHNVKLIADGGIKYSGDIAKAIGAGADVVMIGSIFAGTDESPGDVILYQGRSYKSYRGMGSIGAMSRGSADRYFQVKNAKLVPEGVEGIVPFKGSINDIVYQFIGGLKSAMGYTGNKNIRQMKENCRFVKITNAGFRESHAHDVLITKESPNYTTGNNYL